MPAPTRCCHVPPEPWLTTDRLRVERCPTCGTLWIDHTGPQLADATWQEPDITPEFLRALARRRERQAEVVLRAVRDLPAPVLDYGCGQAVFFDRARRAGLDVWASDLALPDGSLAAGAPTFLPVDEPWVVPPGPGPDGAWGTVVLLDVLEHHPDPSAFLASLPAERIVVKVPLLSGPVGVAARSLARTGRAARFEALALVGEANPHRVFFSRRGLERVAAPRTVARHVPLADVGTELPERMTGRAHGVTALPLRVAGGALAGISPVWSDTGVFVLA